MLVRPEHLKQINLKGVWKGRRITWDVDLAVQEKEVEAQAAEEDGKTLVISTFITSLPCRG